MRIFGGFAAVMCALALSGCAGTTELGDRAIIQAAAIDYDGAYRVSALLFSSGGGDSIDAASDNVINVTAEGETLSEAITNLSLIEGKTVYMCETKLLIFGSGFREKELTTALDTLYRDMRCGLNTPVCCAEEAALVTSYRFTEGITSAEKPLSIIENAYRAGVSPMPLLLDILANEAAGRPTLIPHFTPAQNGSGVSADGSGETIVLDGSRYISGGVLTGFFDSAETALRFADYG